MVTLTDLSTLSISKLAVMLGRAYSWEDAGHAEVSINTEQAIEILERLIAFEEGKQ